VVLILGGVDKGNDFTLITQLVKEEKVKDLVCLGSIPENSRAFQHDVPVIVKYQFPQGKRSKQFSPG